MVAAAPCQDDSQRNYSKNSVWHKREFQSADLRLSMAEQDGTFATMDKDGFGNSDKLPAEDDDHYVSSIAPYVLKSLANCNFFEALDERLCPADSSKSREGCRGDYGISEAILRFHGFSEEDLADVFEVLRSRGGFCDCEILYNAPGDNRLKGEYWRARAAGQEPGSTHKQSR